MRASGTWLAVALIVCALQALEAQEPARAARETHPCVLAGAGDLDLLRERCGREPYKGWRASIERTASDALAADPASLGDAYQRASRAKALAFLAWLDAGGRAARVDRAILCLSAIEAPIEKGRFTGNYVHFPNACTDAAEAYDFLAAVCGIDDPRLAPIRARLVELARALHDSDPGWYAWHWNNWQIRQYSSLGIFALVLSDEPDAAKWAKTAGNAVKKCYDYQACGDGAWAEGHAYFAYSAEQFLPYFFALRRSGGRDSFAEPMVRETHEWAVKSRLPNGRRPNFDDSDIARYPSHWLTSAWKDSGVFRWDWETSDEPTWAGFSLVDAICFYDDRIAATPPTWSPTQFLVEGGDIIFRSGWDKDAIYMNARAEHGDPRTHGGGHEHPDETSFILYSGSTPLCIDSGYINYKEHAKVYNAENHSLILVDGKGRANSAALGAAKGVGGDAFAGPCFTSEAMDYAEIRTEYEGVAVTRCIALIEKRFFVMVDDCRSDASHRYEWLLHVPSAYKSGTWQRPPHAIAWHDPGKFGVKMYSSEPFDHSQSKNTHSDAYGVTGTHPVLRVAATGRHWRTTTVLIPALEDRLGDGETVIWQGQMAGWFWSGPGKAQGYCEDPAWSEKGVEGWSLDAQDDGGFTLRVRTQTPECWLLWRGCTVLSLDGQRSIAAGAPITWLAKANPRPTTAEGGSLDGPFHSDSGPVTLDLPWMDAFGEVRLDDVILPTQIREGGDGRRVTVPKSGRLVIRWL